jgi:hypothetical protein
MSSVCARFAIRQRPEPLVMEFNAGATIGDVRRLLSAFLSVDMRRLKANKRILYDNETVGSAVLASDSAIVVNPQVIPTVKGSRPHPASWPVGLPPRAGRPGRELIEARVCCLAELGYTRRQCERALEAADLNVDTAAEYLISGQILATSDAADLVSKP